MAKCRKGCRPWAFQPSHWSDLKDLLPLAFACFLLAAVETAAVGRTFAAKHGGRLDANQEFVALAAANLAAGLGQGFPASGGMSQSAVNEGGGARTPLSGAIAASVTRPSCFSSRRCSSPYRSRCWPRLCWWRSPACSAYPCLEQLWRGDRRELAWAPAALLGVLGDGSLAGCFDRRRHLACATASSRLYVSMSRCSAASQAPAASQMAERHPDNELIPGVLIVRPESALLYFNVDYVRDVILDRTRTGATPPRLVVLDLSASPLVDLQGSYALVVRANELAAAGIRVQVVEARFFGLRDRLRCDGVDVKLGSVDRGLSVADAVDAFQKQTTT